MFPKRLIFKNTLRCVLEGRGSVTLSSIMANAIKIQAMQKSGHLIIF